MNVRTKHWTLKPHRNMRQHKVFLRHELLKYNSEKSTAKSSALENYISSANLSLSGCSSAEPNSVSVGRCKFQLKKLYLQTVKKVDHLPNNKSSSDGLSRTDSAFFKGFITFETSSKAFSNSCPFIKYVIKKNFIKIYISY